MTEFCALFSVVLSAQTAIPQTRAGQALRDWLEAYNSGDRARVEAFVQKFEPSVSADVIMAFHDVNGRIELAGVEKADNSHITFKIRQQGSESRAVGELVMGAGNPALIQSFNFTGLKQLAASAVTIPNR